MGPYLVLWHLVLVSCRSEVTVLPGGGGLRKAAGEPLQTASPWHQPPGEGVGFWVSCEFPGIMHVPFDLEPGIVLQRLFPGILGSQLEPSSQRTILVAVRAGGLRGSARCPQEIET